jgi:hypothetical protein
MKRAWVLNLEADDERARAKGWTPPMALLATIDAQAQRLVGTLVTGDDVVIARGDTRTLGREFTGEAWSPTPRALAAMKAAGVVVPEVPSGEVLDFVCSREFAQGLLPCEPRERMVTSVEDDGGEDGPTRVSLAYTCAGRGHWLCETAEQRREAIARGLAKGASAKRAPVFVAERVEVLEDFALHGEVRRDRSVRLGQPTAQRVDPRTNAWRESSADAALSERERDALFEHGRDAAEALGRAGYWGPFGIDAFRYRARDGSVRFCPRCELNARYTMAWGIGMGRG